MAPRGAETDDRQQGGCRDPKPTGARLSGHGHRLGHGAPRNSCRPKGHTPWVPAPGPGASGPRSPGGRKPESAAPGEGEGLRRAQEVRFSCWGSSGAVGSPPLPPEGICASQLDSPGHPSPRGSGAPTSSASAPSPHKEKATGDRCGCPASLARERQLPPRRQGSRAPPPSAGLPPAGTAAGEAAGQLGPSPHPRRAPLIWLRSAPLGGVRGVGRGAGHRGEVSRRSRERGTRPPVLGAGGCPPGRSGQRARGGGHLRVQLREAVG